MNLVTTCHHRVEVVKLQQEGISEATVIPAFGGNLIEFSIYKNSQPIPVVELADFSTLLQNFKSRGSPILFPFPNRVKDGKFEFEGKEYNIRDANQTNQEVRHGLVRDKPFEVDATGASEAGAWSKCSINSEKFPEIRRKYPFPFLLEVTYTLRGYTLEMLSKITNTGDHKMPFGLGIHPYYRMPKRGTIQIPANSRWEFSDNLPTGKILDLEGEYDLRNPKDVNSITLDDVFTNLDTIDGNLSRCILDDEEMRLRVIIEFDATLFRNAVVYTPDPPRQAIAIETYSSPTNALNLHNEIGVDKSHLIILPPGDARTFCLRYIVEPY